MTTRPLVPTLATVDKVGVLEQLRAGLEEPPDTIIGGSLVVSGVARAANALAVSGGLVTDCGTTGTGGGGGGTGAGTVGLGRGGVGIDCTGIGGGGLLDAPEGGL